MEMKEVRWTKAIEVDSHFLRLWGPDENSIASALASPRLVTGEVKHQPNPGMSRPH